MKLIKRKFILIYSYSISRIILSILLEMRFEELKYSNQFDDSITLIKKLINPLTNEHTYRMKKFKNQCLYLEEKLDQLLYFEIRFMEHRLTFCRQFIRKKCVRRSIYVLIILFEYVLNQDLNEFAITI